MRKFFLKSHLYLLSVVLLFSINLQLQSQGRSDFYDSYDYSLRNYKGGQSIGEDTYQDYKLPRPRKKPTLLDPKNVRREVDPSLIVPPPAGIRRANTSANRLPDPSSYPVNPITGDLNVDAILKNQDEKKLKKENEKKLREEKEKIVYSETSLRRTEIIFFTTLPFAIGGSALIALFINQFQDGFYKSNTGAAFVAVSAFTISGLNAYYDRLNIEDHEREKKLFYNLNSAPQSGFNQIQFTFPLFTGNF